MALWLLLKYLSKTQNSFANIKEERVKKKKRKKKNGLLDHGKRKRKAEQKSSGEKRVIEEAKLRFIIG